MATMRRFEVTYDRFKIIGAVRNLLCNEFNKIHVYQ
jgi:hypothetical protein